jgi:hypothetical protein
MYLDHSLACHGLDVIFLHKLAALARTNSSFVYCASKNDDALEKSSAKVLVYILQFHCTFEMFRASGGKPIWLSHSFVHEEQLRKFLGS